MDIERVMKTYEGIAKDFEKGNLGFGEAEIDPKTMARVMRMRIENARSFAYAGDAAGAETLMREGAAGLIADFRNGVVECLIDEVTAEQYVETCLSWIVTDDRDAAPGP